MLLFLRVGTDGLPFDVRVIRGGDHAELDAKCVKAVSEYCFKPAMQDGRPVAEEMNVEINVDAY